MPWLHLWGSWREAPEGVAIRAAGTPTFFTIHHSLFTIHLTLLQWAGTETVPLRILLGVLVYGSNRADVRDEVEGKR